EYSNMKIIALLLFFHLSMAVICQPDIIIDTIHSKILGEDRYVWLHLPDKPISGSFLKKSYPVVYVLDAEANFKLTIEILNLFNGYAAIDPSMWWDDQQLLKQSKAILAEGNFKNISLFLAIANTMNKEMNDVSEITKDTSKKTVLIRTGVALADQLDAATQNK